MDLIGGSNTAGQQIEQYAPNQSTAQQWTISEVDSGIFTVANGGSGMVLDGQGTGGGTPVVQNLYTGSQTQQWAISPYTDGGYKLLNVASGMNLGVNLSNNLTSQGGSAVSWVLQHAQSFLPNGKYEIGNLYSGQFLGVPESQCGYGTGLAQAAPGTAATVWTVSNVGNGLYSVVNSECNTALDNGAITTSGGVAVEYGYYGGTNQLWLISENGEGTFSLINAANGLSISVGSATATGSAVTQNTWAQTTDQMWVMRPH